MNFNITYDSSMTAEAEAVIQSVAQFFDNHFADNITINITASLGDLGPNGLGHSNWSFNSFSYSAIQTALSGDATTADDTAALANAVPSTDPISGTHTYWMVRAEQKALGLLSGTDSGSDGSVTFANAANTFDFNRADGITAGLYDFAGTVAHELTEVMGRSLNVGGTVTDGGGTAHPNSNFLFDLFHYSADGTRSFSGTTAGYFSLDNGATDLNDFNTISGGDAGDWGGTALVGNDSFLAFSNSGVVNAVMNTDFRVMDVLGWDLVNQAPTIAPLSASVGEDGPTLSQDVLSGSADADGDFLVVQSLDGSVTTAGGRHLTLGIDYTLSGSTLALTAAGFAQFNDLAQGASDTIVFGYDISDFLQPVHNTFTVTVNGVNDPPSLAGDTGSPHALNELSNVTGSTAPDAVSGSLAFTDADVGDIHSASASLSTATWSGGTIIPFVSASALAAAMSASISLDGTSGTLDWDFSLADHFVDFLAIGETLTATYDVTVADNHSGTSTQQVTVVFSGANDIPLIDTGASILANSLSELPLTTGSSATDSTDGAIVFSDADLNDRPTASIDAAHQTVTWHDATHDFTSELSAEQIALLDGALSIAAAASNTNSGTINWAYNITDSNLDFLSAGETLTVTTPVILDDHHGGVVTEDIVVTINGANDNPIAIADSNGTSKNSTLNVSAAHGVLANDTDPDAHDQDNLSVESVNGSTTSVGHSVVGTYGTLTLNEDGSYVYAANRGALPSQIVAQDVFNYSITDGHGGTATSTLSIVVSNPGVVYQGGINTTINGNNGPDVVDGSFGHDIVLGGNGPDVLIGGPGDTLTGGNSPDTFLFRPHFGANTITDFDIRNDVVQLDRSIFSGPNDVASHIADSAAGAVLSDGLGDAITFTGVTAAQLTSHLSDFHLV